MKIRFRIQIHSCFASVSSGDVFLNKFLNLPFVPTIGMTVSDGDWECVANELAYDNRTGILTCYAESDEEIYQAQLHKQEHRSLDEIVKEYVEAGWIADK